MKVFARVFAGRIGLAQDKEPVYQVLGEPLLLHVLKEIKKVDFIDEIFVLTNNRGNGENCSEIQLS